MPGSRRECQPESLRAGRTTTQYHPRDELPMLRTLLKLIGLIAAGCAGLLVVGSVVYVAIYYPRSAEPFEIQAQDPTHRLLIATQGSGFKNRLVASLCDSLSKSPVYIKGMDVGELGSVDPDEWDRVLVITSFMVRLNRSVDSFLNGADTAGNSLLLVTSGGADWQPQPGLAVDAITSASRQQSVTDLVHLIVDWLNHDSMAWEPADRVLALRYLTRLDVASACAQIASSPEHYRRTYPDLASMINRSGYQYIRTGDMPSALRIFRLNVILFPDSWNVYDSYGEALLLEDYRAGAITNYQKALELNPDSKSAKAALTRLADG
jgi:hypothetical protein